MATGTRQAGWRQAARVRERAEREQRWRLHLAAWGRSGLSQAEYCRRLVLKAADFSWWKQELARRDQRGLGGCVRVTGMLGPGAGPRDAASRRGVRSASSVLGKRPRSVGSSVLVEGTHSQQTGAPLAGECGTRELSAKTAAFLPVRVTAPLCAYPYEVSLRSGHVLRLGGEFAPESVRTLVAVLEGGAAC